MPSGFPVFGSLEPENLQKTINLLQLVSHGPSLACRFPGNRTCKTAWFQGFRGFSGRDGTVLRCWPRLPLLCLQQNFVQKSLIFKTIYCTSGIFLVVKHHNDSRKHDLTYCGRHSGLRRGWCGRRRCPTVPPSSQHPRPA